MQHSSNFLRLLSALAAIIAFILSQGCHPSHPESNTPLIATTTSYLEAAARDLMGQEVRIVRLAEPGTCPGHFDIRPSQVSELRHCRALLRFDFQKSLDSKLAGADTNFPRIVEISVHGGMARPESYVSACQQVSRGLVEVGLVSQSDANARLQVVSARLDSLAREATNGIASAGFRLKPVLASSHQRDFCEWLGLRVAASFRAADTASIAELETAIDQGKLAQIQLVIANLPEGRRTADALGERLQARVVVFENFPALRDGRVSFDAMFTNNLEALLQANGR